MNDNWSNQQVLEPEKKSGIKPWVWVVGVIVICLCLACATVFGVFLYFGREPEGLSLSYSIPATVHVNDEFDFVLTITNTGNETIAIDEIDLDEYFGGSILDGCVVLETDPDMERDYSLEGIKTFKYNQSIAPGETQEVTFHLQAVNAGEYGGSVGVYVGDISTRIDYVGITILK